MKPPTSSGSCLATLICALATGAIAQDAIYNHVPASADAVLSVNLHKLANDPLTSQVLALASMKDVREKIGQLSLATNVDIRRDLDRLVFARTLSEPDDSTVLLVKGNFDPSRIRPLVKLAAGNAETTTIGDLKDVLTWRSDNLFNERNCLAFLPDGVAVLTFSPARMKETLAGPGAKLENLLPFIDGGSSTINNAIAWMHVPNADGVSDDPTLKALPVKSIDAVVDSDADELSATLQARLESPERTRDIVDMAKGLQALLRLKGNPIVSRIQLNTDATSQSILASINYSRDEVRHLMPLLDSQISPPRFHYSGATSATGNMQMDLARMEAQRARQFAEMGRKRAEVARKRAELQREQYRIDRELRMLNADSDVKTTGTVEEPPAPPAPPVPPPPPISPFSAEQQMPATGGVSAGSSALFGPSHLHGPQFIQAPGGTVNPEQVQQLTKTIEAEVERQLRETSGGQTMVPRAY